MDFVWIEPGAFTMGSPETEIGRDPDEGPYHEVTISTGFWMGRYETTQEQWEAVTGSQPWLGLSGEYIDPAHPVFLISWSDAQDFVRQLNNAEGDSLYRLPTEAEWEYTCRAGTTTRWSFGDETQLGDHAWYWENAWNMGIHHPLRVGTRTANPWGLHDMHGNVAEWVQDWFGDYAGGTQMDPIGPPVRSASRDPGWYLQL